MLTHTNTCSRSATLRTLPVAPLGNCPAGTTVCGAGAIGIDNLWHDAQADGSEEPAGSNPPAEGVAVRAASAEPAHKVFS